MCALVATLKREYPATFTRIRIWTKSGEAGCLTQVSMIDVGIETQLPGDVPRPCGQVLGMWTTEKHVAHIPKTCPQGTLAAFASGLTRFACLILRKFTKNTTNNRSMRIARNIIC